MKPGLVRWWCPQQRRYAPAAWAQEHRGGKLLRCPLCLQLKLDDGHGWGQGPRGRSTA